MIVRDQSLLSRTLDLRPFEWNSIKGTTDGMYVCPRCMIDRLRDD